MPSIEILAVGAVEPVDCDAYEFAVHVDPTRRSHRTNFPFHPVFDRHGGILYHLGNPRCRRDDYGGFFFASDLLIEHAGPSRFLRFRESYRSEVAALLERLIVSSPQSTLFFVADYQFSPNRARLPVARTIGEFWKLHDAGKVRFRALYPIFGGVDAAEAAARFRGPAASS